MNTKQWLQLPLLAAITTVISACGDVNGNSDSGRISDNDSSETIGSERPGGGGDNGSSSDGENSDGGSSDNGSIPPGTSAQQQFCNGDTVFEIDSTNLNDVTEDSPFAIDSNIVVTFNAIIKEDVLSNDSVNLMLADSGAMSVASQLSIDEATGKTLTIDPDMSLENDKTYKLVINEQFVADCDPAKNLSEEFEKSFITAPEIDVTPPELTEVTPADGESLAPVNSSILLTFSEAIDKNSFINEDSFTLIAVQANGDALADAMPVDGTFESVADQDDQIIFNPTENLNPSEYYQVRLKGDSEEAGNKITDKSNNALAEDQVKQFRTGSLVVGLNDTVIERIPGIGDVLNLIGGGLLSALEVGEADDGLDSVDNLVIIKLPLSQDLLDAFESGDPRALQELVSEETATAFDSILIAVCDPKSINLAGEFPDCVLSVDLGLDATQLAAAIEAAQNSPGEFPGLIANAIVDENDGLGLELRLLDDNSLFLPEELEEPLNMLLTGLEMIPVLGDLLSQDQGDTLAVVDLLEGSILGVALGDLLEVDLLDREAITGGLVSEEGGSGLINLDGTLTDVLLGDPIGGFPINPIQELINGTCFIRLICADSPSQN